MKINGTRKFKGTDGKRYFVQNSCKSDCGKGKYILTMQEGDFYKICYDNFMNVMYFKTIKDAQREVLFHSDFITTF